MKITMAVDILDCREMISPMEPEFFGSVTVSYTHLDVYKRQAPPKAPTAPPAQTKAPHEHNWVEQYTIVNIPAKTHTVHHDAVYQTVHHDAITHEEPVYEYHQVCNVCGEDFGYGPDAIEAVGDHSAVTDHSYSSQKVCVGSTTVTDQEAYDEQRLVSEAYDETVVDEQARTEQRLTGYKCSGCGATKN